MGLQLKELIKIGAQQMTDAGVENAEFDAKELYCYMRHLERMRLIFYMQETQQDNQCEAYFDLVAKRASRIPLQHIIGETEFMGLTFQVDENVLIPRQDTETLVEDALEVMKQNTLRGEELPRKKQSGWSVLDLGCGSGAIGVSIAKLNSDAKVICSDFSKAALSMAEKNAHLNGASVKFTESDMFEGFKGRLGNKKFDLIISNPPYIPTDVIPTLAPEVKDHEPLCALDGGADGLDYYRIIAAQAPGFLKKHGVLMMEIGYDQKEAVCDLLEKTGAFCFIRGLQDLAGKDRIVMAILDDPKKKQKNS